MTIEKLNIFTITLLFVMALFIHISRKENRYHGSYDYFRAVVFALAILVCLEILSWLFEGVSGKSARYLNFGLNSLMFYYSAIPLTMWFIYFDEKIFQSERSLMYKRLFYMGINIIIFLLVSVNFVKPILFEVTSANTYMGHGGLIIIGSIQILYMAVYMAIVVIQKQKIPYNVFQAIVYMFSLPFLAIGLQAYNPNFIMLTPILVFNAYLTFFIIERQEMIKDALTGLSLRRHMESRLIHLQDKEKDFTLILIDLDDFKLFNDRYGHEIGDQILIAFAGMLNKAIHRVDTAYRYAGDEFVILYEGHDNIVNDSIISKLKIQMKTFNENSNYAHPLGMSYGLIRINAADKESIETIMKRVDQDMYESKRTSRKKS